MITARIGLELCTHGFQFGVMSIIDLISIKPEIKRQPSIERSIPEQ